MTKLCACGFHRKQLQGILMHKRGAAGIYESSRFARATLTPPVCIQEAPAKLAVRKPSGPIQRTIQ
eukprot:9360244-Pyramimonas_sp.AAC.1